MSDERTREQMMRAAKEMRDFYQSLSVRDETTQRAVSLALNDVSTEERARKKKAREAA